MKTGLFAAMATVAMAMALSLVSLPAFAQRGRGDVVTCGSVDGRYARCQVPWQDADLVHKDSDASCDRGRSWGFDRGGIWVDKGCRGQFVEVGRRGPGGPGGWNDRPPREQIVQCGSVDGRYRVCNVDIGRDADVRLVANDSDTRCEQGRNWGVSRDGIWVNNGCRGRFAIRNRW